MYENDRKECTLATVNADILNVVHGQTTGEFDDVHRDRWAVDSHFTIHFHASIYYIWM